MKRCGWTRDDAMMNAYHDEEWGVPLHEDRALYGKLVLDGFQAGLSWQIILRKRDNFRRAFDDWNPAKIARFDQRRVAKLMADAGIVRNRAKIEGAITSARAFEALVEKERFDAFLWEFVGGKPKVNRWRALSQIPAETDESRAMSKALKQRGFAFCGPTICYAFMQAVGMVNDHLTTCFRYPQLK
jgi:DNA-3-methyladenine glycosylase I